jgi:hypothetical protein
MGLAGWGVNESDGPFFVEKPFGASGRGRNAEAFLYGLHDAMESLWTFKIEMISATKRHKRHKNGSIFDTVLFVPLRSHSSQ